MPLFLSLELTVWIPYHPVEYHASNGARDGTKGFLITAGEVTVKEILTAEKVRHNAYKNIIHYLAIEQNSWKLWFSPRISSFLIDCQTPFFYLFISILHWGLTLTSLSKHKYELSLGLVKNLNNITVDFVVQHSKIEFLSVPFNLCLPPA